MRVVMDVRLVLVLSSRILASTMCVVNLGVVVIVSMDRAQMFEFSSRTAYGVMGHMYVLVIVKQPFVPVALKTLNHRKYTSFTQVELSLGLLSNR